MVNDMYYTFIEFVKTLGQFKDSEWLIALGIFSANLTERFCQNDAVQLTFKSYFANKTFYQNARSYFNSCRSSWLPNG